MTLAVSGRKKTENGKFLSAVGTYVPILFFTLVRLILMKFVMLTAYKIKIPTGWWVFDKNSHFYFLVYWLERARGFNRLHTLKIIIGNISFQVHGRWIRSRFFRFPKKLRPLMTKFCKFEDSDSMTNDILMWIIIIEAFFTTLTKLRIFLPK